MDRARTLQVAVWLHQLDMAAGGDGMASETLEALQHHQGPLLESFLTPMMSNLTFQEVVDCVLHENRCDSEHPLNYFRACHACTRKAVQPPRKSTRRGVTSNPSTDKTVPMGSPSSQDPGRPTTRGWGDGGRSVSHPRGVKERVSVQLPCQDGDLPSGSMPSVPPPAAPERTPPQQGVSQRPPTMIPCNWRQNFTVQGGRRTLSMC